MKNVEWHRGNYAIFPTNYECLIGKFRSVTASNSQKLTPVEWPCYISNKLRLSNWYVQVNFCVKKSTCNGQRTKNVEWSRGLYAIFPTNYEYPFGKFGSVTSLNNPQVRTIDVKWPPGNYDVFPTNYECPIGMSRSISASKNPHVMAKRMKYVEWSRGLYAKFPTNYEYLIG